MDNYRSREMNQAMRETREAIDEACKDLWQMYYKMIEIFIAGNLSTNTLLEFLKFAEKALKVFCLQLGLERGKLYRLFFAVHAAEATARKMLESEAKVRGKWEAIVWKLVSLLATHKTNFPNFDVHLQPSPNLKKWVLKVFSESDVCPNTSLRLEMLHLIAMWRRDELQCPETGEKVMSGLIDTCGKIGRHHLIPSNSRSCLTFSLSSVLTSLGKYGYLTAVSEASVRSLETLEITRETRFLFHLVEVLGQMTERLRRRCEAANREIPVPETHMALENMYYILVMLIVSPSLRITWTSPGLAQKAALAIVTATTSTLALLPSVKTIDPQQYQRLLEYIDILFSTLSRSRTLRPVYLILRQDHCKDLSDMREMAQKNGCPYVNIPCRPQFFKDLAKDCPEEFLDSITQTVMVKPVKLVSSGMVIDEATLVHLLITSPVDPFTRCPLGPDSFTRQPHLRQQIGQWRKSCLLAADQEDHEAQEAISQYQSDSDQR